MIRVFDDLHIVLNEANYADEKILKKHNLNVKSNNTVGISITINLVLETLIDYLNSGLELDLYGVNELPMVFNYLRYVYQMIFYNRKAML